jgi:hypothetical protein
MKDIKRLQNAPRPIQTTLPFKEMNWASSSSLNNPHKTILKDLASKKKCMGTSCYSMKNVSYFLCKFYEIHKVGLPS